ncbi:MAG: PilZ domain-containing protein, partial [Hyphomicrobiales bacterium]|nr:PilZ domain-containing protein [Hyphomicrobiales bacterium]
MLFQHYPPCERNRAHIVQDRRRHQRVNVPLNGRFMRADKQEFPCSVTNVSPGGLALLAPAS